MIYSQKVSKVAHLAHLAHPLQHSRPNEWNMPMQPTQKLLAKGFGKMPILPILLRI
jgi:hypothetical protein